MISTVPRRRPVARRLIFRLTGVGLLLATAAIGLELYVEYQRNIAAIEDRFAAVESGYLPSIRENAWLDDRERLDILVQGVHSMPGIAEVAVRAPDGTLLAYIGAAPVEAMARVWTLSHPYGGKDYPLGDLSVTAGLETLRAAATRRLIEASTGYVAVIVLLAALLYLQVHELVTRQLTAIAAYARRLGRDGPRDTPSIETSPTGPEDEFSDLARTLGRMRSELADAYDAIAASEARFRELFTSSPVSLWEGDFSAVRTALAGAAPDVEDFAGWLRDNPDFVTACAARVRIIDVNDATVRMHRADSRVELLERLPAILTSDNYDAFRQQLTAIREGRHDLRLDTQVRTVDGDVLDVVLHWHVPPQHRATLGRVIVSQENVGALKNAQRSTELTLEKLAQSNAELERFTYVASHDLQEPVRLVVSFSQLVGRRLRQDGKLDPDIAEDMRFLEAAANRMQDQVAGLLEYTRAGQTSGGFAPVALGEAFSVARDQLAAGLDAAAATVTAEGLPVISGDRTQLIQLFRHLLDNALKFRHPQRPLVFEVTAERNGSFWRVSVSDNGIGIDPPYAERVFEVFRQLHGPGRYPGAGIGLAICRRVVQRHGGDIAIDTRRTGGTTIVFTLPASPES